MMPPTSTAGGTLHPNTNQLTTTPRHCNPIGLKRRGRFRSGPGDGLTHVPAKMEAEIRLTAVNFPLC
jgi:hypothetical protein